MLNRKTLALSAIILLTGAVLTGSQLAIGQDSSTLDESSPEAQASTLETTPRPSHAGHLLAAVSGEDNPLLLQGNLIADIAESAAPAVVNIECEKPGAGGLQSMLPFGGGSFRFFYNNREIDPERMGGMARPIKSTGSGFIVRADGYILTNAHVVKGMKRIEVTLNDGRNLVATVAGIDTFSDLAVLKIDATNLPILKMGSSTKLRPGEFAIAIGSPLGYDHTVTLGIISALGRTVYDINDNINFIQTDAAINQGNSGGPLLNLKGEVIGVNTAVVKGLVAQNIGFSIPIDVAKTVCEDLIAHKKILRPFLGIGMKEVSETMAKSLGLGPNTRGVVIAEIYEGSSAEKAGLKKQDIIQKIDGKDVQSPKDIREYVRAKKIGDLLNFYVLRNSSPEAVAVRLGEYPSSLGGEEEAVPGGADGNE